MVPVFELAEPVPGALNPTSPTALVALLRQCRAASAACHQPNCDSGGSNSSCATVSASIVWVGSSNDLDIDVGETADASGATINITGASGSDSNTIAATIDGTSVVLTLNVNGDTNNYLIDIDGNGDSIGHTLVHSHTGSIADVDITQSGVYDNMINLTTSGDNHNIDIIQRD